MKYKATVASTNIDDNLERFSAHAISDMQRGVSSSIPIFEDGVDSPLPNSKVLGVYLEDNALSIIVQSKYNLDSYYLVPHIRVIESHNENGIRVLDRVELYALSLTNRPADQTLASIEVLK